jgi:exopolyphosphatase/guanosine-5'-triphosphate,3'-diphosphate pyrophosphatase
MPEDPGGVCLGAVSAAIVPRWEWRSFGESFGSAEAALTAHAPERVHETDELYLLSPESDASVKVRDALMDVKQLEGVNADGLEQWRPVMKAPFPLGADDVRFVLDALHAPPAASGLPEYGLDDLAGLALTAKVHKRRAHYRIDGCLAELSELRVGQRATHTIAVEGEDPGRVIAAVRHLGLAGRRNVSVARGIKALLGVGAHRFAVIDVGTNSVKLHVAERAADGEWHTLADRAEVTRLGEGLHQSRRMGAEPMRRTTEAIAALAAEARGLGATEIAAVGTAGLRIAPNAGELIAAVHHACGVRVEVIPGDEEARLAFVAATAGLSLGAGTLVVFDTGGGSSQFTIGNGARIAEQFSVDVGSVRLTERFGLDRAVSPDVVAAACAEVAAGFGRLSVRAAPSAVIGMGGAVTNLTAVELALAPYDPDVIQGSVLQRADIERQIAHYRALGAEGRRAIVGLQPARAEVILAGACIVRTVLDVLGAEALTVSDRALRHGLIADRFGI